MSAPVPGPVEAAAAIRSGEFNAFVHLDRDGALGFAADGPPPSMIAGVEVNPNSDGMPDGLQVIGRRHQDEVPLRLAHILEQARPWPQHAPEPWA